MGYCGIASPEDDQIGPVFHLAKCHGAFANPLERHTGWPMTNRCRGIDSAVHVVSYGNRLLLGFRSGIA